MIIFENRLRVNRSRELLKDSPDHWIREGNLFYQQKKFTQALVAYTRAIDQDSNNAQGWNLKGLTLWELKRYEVAIGAYSTAVKRDPDYAIAWINLGNALFFLDRYREASNAFNKALEIDPKNADGWNDRGNVLIAGLKKHFVHMMRPSGWTRTMPLHGIIKGSH